MTERPKKPSSARDILSSIHQRTAGESHLKKQIGETDADRDRRLVGFPPTPEGIRDAVDATTIIDEIANGSLLEPLERIRARPHHVDPQRQLDRIEAKLDTLLSKSDPAAIQVYTTMPDMRRNDQPERPEPERWTIELLEQQLPVSKSFFELNQELLRMLLAGSGSP